ncbi:MAG: hypothetical protein ACRDHO_11835 [Actinomycetota bacterium]
MEDLLSASPLREILECHPAPRVTIAHQVSAAAGGTPSANHRLILRILRGQPQLNVHIADRLAIGLGRDAAEVWGDRW